MTRRTFLRFTTGTVALAAPARWQRDATAPADGVHIRLIRNATCVVRYGGRTLLVDPFLSDAGVLPPFDNSPNPRPNPLVPLPIAAAQVVANVDATLLTHTHVDHWDGPARDLLPKAGTLFAQPADVARLSQAGFTGVRQVDTSLSWEGTTITRTGGQHGRGEVGQRMGAVSGYVLTRPGAPTVYIAGDTIWCGEVADAIRAHNPHVIVVNAGQAQFLEGGPIIMGVEDVVKVCEAAPQARIVAVHMEAVNHCVLSRDMLRAGLDRLGVKSRVLIPRDGDDVRLA